MSLVVHIVKDFDHKIENVRGIVLIDEGQLIVRFKPEYAVSSDDFFYMFGHCGIRILKTDDRNRILEAKIESWAFATKPNVPVLPAER
jgi:hypothetical protein